MSEHSHISSVPERTRKAAQFSTPSVMVNKPVIVPPLLWMFSANLLPEVMLVNCLAWRNKLLKNNRNPTAKKQHQNALDV
jgi:hypothetical protein